MYCDGPDNGFKGRNKGYYYWLLYKYQKGKRIDYLTYAHYRATWKNNPVKRIKAEDLKKIAGVSGSKSQKNSI